MIDTFTKHQTQALRADAKAGKTPRYIVRCGLLTNGRVVVWDAIGGWVCSTHKNLALANKRAAELNAQELIAATEEARAYLRSAGLA